MAPRQIKNIVWAEPCLRPGHIPVQRAKRGSKGAGLRFEARLAKALGPRVTQGQWFRFLDDNGPGHCQPDLLILGRKLTIVIECKLTFTLEGLFQLQELYFPVLDAAYGKPILGILACRNLTPQAPLDRTFPSLRNAIETARDGKISVFHWFGAAGVDL